MDPPWPGMGFPDAGMGPPWPGVDFFGLEILALSLAWALLGPQRICEPSGVAQPFGEAPHTGRIGVQKWPKPQILTIFKVLQCVIFEHRID